MKPLDEIEVPVAGQWLVAVVTSVTSPDSENALIHFELYRSFHLGGCAWTREEGKEWRYRQPKRGGKS